MNLYPLIERELRVAARRSLTWWLRVAIGAIAITVGLGVAAAQSHPVIAGRFQFGILSVTAFLLMLLSGLRHAALPLAEENREGTLPLLLLTPLSRREIIAGKVAAGAIESLAGLLVFVPVLMLPVLSGGVRWLEVSLAVVALLATLILSLAAGNFVGAIRDHEMKAMLRTALMLLLVCVPFGWMFVGIRLTTEIDLNQRRDMAFGLIPKWWYRLLQALLWLGLGGFLMADLVLTESVSPLFFTGSPVYLMKLAVDGDLGPFFVQLGAVVWLSFLIFELASIRLVAITENRKEEEDALSYHVVPSVVERSEGVTITPPTLLHQIASRRARRSPGRVGDASPLRWLLQPPGWMGRLILFGIICSSALMFLLAVTQWLGGTGVAEVLPVALVPLMLVSVLFWPAFYFFVALQMARLFAESRRSGSIELLLVTPHFREVAIREQWQALRRLIQKPLLWYVAVVGVAGLLAEFNRGGEMVQFAAGGFYAAGRNLSVLSWVLDSVDLVLAVIAIGWFAMWRAWVSPRPMLGPLQAFFMVVVVPFIFLRLMTGILMGLSLFGFAGWLAGHAVQALGIGYSLALIWIARTRLTAAFAPGEAPPELRRQ